VPLDENPPTLADLRSGARRRNAPVERPVQESLIFARREEITVYSASAEPDETEAQPAVKTPSRPLSAERRVWSVGELVADIRVRAERAYADVWVEGEISNCRPAASGHLYFTLRDGDSQLPVVLFRRQAQLLRFRAADGLAVLVRGRISIYESRGQLQMIAETVEPRGAGALQLAFEQLKTRLMAEGLFDAARKRALPAFPHCIGVVTSPAGAVIRDIVTIVRRRHGRLNLLVYPAVMQGASCPSTVAAGIRWFNKHPELVDLIVLARGGGSPEDLAGFNDEALARIIAASKLPVVSAIGHETDFTIADFVADLRAPTPSAAAELITATQHRVEERINSLTRRLERSARLHLVEAQHRFADLSAIAVLRSVRDSLGRRGQLLDEFDVRLSAAAHRSESVRRQRLNMLAMRLRRCDPALRTAQARRHLERVSDRLRHYSLQATLERKHRLVAASARLTALSPLSVLSRGYALVYSAEGKLLRSAADVVQGNRIHARLSQGSVEAEVIKTEITENKNR
jgi:exodeoxyribonuclease VII large subunit